MRDASLPQQGYERLSAMQGDVLSIVSAWPDCHIIPLLRRASVLAHSIPVLVSPRDLHPQKADQTHDQA